MAIYDAKGHQNLTVSTVAVGLTVPSAPLTANFALITVETAAVRYRDDGTAPTSGVGIPLAVGAVLEYDGPLAAIKFIRSSGSDATLNISYYRYP